MPPFKHQALGKRRIMVQEEERSVETLGNKTAIKAKGYSGGIHGATVISGCT